MSEYVSNIPYGPHNRIAESIESKFASSKDITEIECEQKYNQYLATVINLLPRKPSEGKHCSSNLM